MSLGQRIKDRRQALKLTQQELAKALKLTPQHISAIEKDKRVPALASLAKLAEELGVTVDYLATGKEGVVTEIIPAIKADKKMSVEVKKALVTLIQALHSNQEKTS
ncbi:MAG: helix-turn-helix transcriptional regulator [Dehalococcoidales bacterium]|nr:helix-turn-helix transcriptional regulator [Dehalococcoidales bacterium]